MNESIFSARHTLASAIRPMGCLAEQDTAPAFEGPHLTLVEQHVESEADTRALIIRSLGSNNEAAQQYAIASLLATTWDLRDANAEMRREVDELKKKVKNLELSLPS